MKLFHLNFTSLILRFYLLMAIVIGSFFAGYPILSILALPLFISAMMGMKFSREKKREKNVTRALIEEPASNSAIIIGQQ